MEFSFEASVSVTVKAYRSCTIDIERQARAACVEWPQQIQDRMVGEHFAEEIADPEMTQ